MTIFPRLGESAAKQQKSIDDENKGKKKERIMTANEICWEDRTKTRRNEKITKK